MGLTAVKARKRFVGYTAGVLLLVCATGIRAWQAGQQAQCDRALLNAIRHNDISSVQSAIAEGAEVNVNNRASLWESFCARSGIAVPLPGPARQERCSTPLMLAIAKRDDAALIGTLLRHGADVRARNVSGDTPLHLAAINSDVPAMRALLTFQADMNAQDALGETPLMKAAEQEGADAVQTLLEHGARADQKNKRGENALDKARQAENIQAILVLQQTKSGR